MRSKYLIPIFVIVLMLGAWQFFRSKHSEVRIDLPVPPLSFKCYAISDDVSSFEVTSQLMDEDRHYYQKLETVLQPLTPEQHYQFVIREIADKRDQRPDFACVAATTLFDDKIGSVQVDPKHCFDALAGWASTPISKRVQAWFNTLNIVYVGMSQYKPYVEKAVHLLETGSQPEKEAARAFLKVVMCSSDSKLLPLSDAETSTAPDSSTSAKKGNEKVKTEMKQLGENMALAISGMTATLQRKSALPAAVVPEVLIAHLRAGAAIAPRDAAGLFSTPNDLKLFRDEMNKTSGGDSTRLDEWLKAASSAKPD